MELNPQVSLSGRVSTLEMKPGYWVQLEMRADYNIKTGKHDKYAVIEVVVTKDGNFKIKCDKNVEVEHWKEE